MSLGQEKTNSLLRDLCDGLLTAELALDKIRVLCRDLSDDFFESRDAEKDDRVAMVMYNYDEAAIKHDIAMDYLAELKRTLEGLQPIADTLYERSKIA